MKLSLKDINFKNLNLSPMQKMMLKMVGVVIGLILVIWIVFGIVGFIGGLKKGYSQIETIMIGAAKKYVEANTSSFSSSYYSETEITVSELVSLGYMKELSKYTKKDVACTGYVIVFQTWGKYFSYTPKLDCGSYYTYTDLGSKLTEPDNIVTKEQGLYYVDNGNYYIYKGQYVNNYVSFAGQLWRIIRIDSDGNLRLLQNSKSEQQYEWDARYNSDKNEWIGINEFEGIADSIFKASMLSLYNNEKLFSQINKSVMIPQGSCIGKRKDNESDMSGNIECGLKSEVMGVTSMYVSEYYQISLDPKCVDENTPSCDNYNYLYDMSGAFWTSTPYASNSWKVYYVSGRPAHTNCYNSKYIRLVTSISGKVNYETGDGSYANPYVINVKG